MISKTDKGSLTRQKKALFVSSIPWSENNRGLLSVVDKLGSKYKVLIAARSIDFEQLRTPDLRIYDLSFSISNRYIRWLMTSNFTFIPFGFFIYICYKHRPDVIYLRESRFYISVVFLRLFFRKMKFFLDIRENPETHYPESVFFLKYFNKSVDEVRTISKELKGHLEAKFNFKNVTFKYSLPTQKFLDSIAFPNKKNNTILKICFFGDIKFDRLVHILVEAVNLSPYEVDCDIYGKIVKESYKEYLDTLNINSSVRFMGEINYEDAPKILTHYDCGFLMNEVNNNSKFTIPGKLWEYTSCGLCVISDKRASVYKFVREYDIGMICSDVKSVVNCIEQFSKDRKSLFNCKKNSIDFFNHISRLQS
jgi:hypothetical protein